MKVFAQRTISVNKIDKAQRKCYTANENGSTVRIAMKFNTKYIGTGFLYFFIHFVTEMVCFFMLSRYDESPPVFWLIYFTYDMLAFVPQAVIGYVSDKFKRIPFGIIGLMLMAIALVLQNTVPLPFLSLVILCLGNACVHVNGAEVTLRVSNGSLTHSAVFISGGSFGVISGKLLSTYTDDYLFLLALLIAAVPFVILAQIYLKRAEKEVKSLSESFCYNRGGVNKKIIIAAAVTVVAVRSYMAYGIPTSWNKTVYQTVLLFVFMGTGKALGGVFSDLFGVRRVALLSVILALPFLMFGDKNMVVSLVGVMFFSMTMTVTLALLVSVLHDTPGLAFGLTTVGLFIGVAPVFFFKIKTLAANCVMLSALTAVCVICFIVSVRKGSADGKHC